ncbi:General alpha-glucoside permease [Drechslerella dactyloides]|uniref:General alpha-glucoside permease n=1 Tax=Drechslerella dactyloides TaxID=74499 RepID=A0AAD6J7M0_DREDA|nr:General alpha-glucoside permease [Drechslerella dactyloides]
MASAARGGSVPKAPKEVTEQSRLLSPAGGDRRYGRSLTINDTGPRRQRSSVSSSMSRRSMRVTRSSWFLMLLTLSIGGLQIAWSVELSNGSPYLLSLGISKAMLALVWVAGPVSGALVQPYVGIRSDNCRIPWGKRKPFMIGGGIATIISLLILGWTKEICAFALPKGSPSLPTVTIWLAVTMIYVLDFSINTVQAGIRAFIVDNAPPHQQDAANAWAGRMTGIGNVLGYLSGYVNLPEILPWFGNTQFKVLCVIASVALGGTLAVSCGFIMERDPNEDGPADEKKNNVLAFFGQVLHSARRLPPQVRRVCDTQFFAWIGWFPFLFYSTTYIGEIYVQPHYAANPNLSKEEERKLWEEATRVGTFALLIFAVVALTANTVLPIFIQPAFNPANADDSGANSKHQRIVAFFRIPGLTLRRLWCFSHVIFAASMWSTFFVKDTWGATALIAACGIPWAVTLWAPFALISADISKRDAIKRGFLRSSVSTTGGIGEIGGEEDYVDQAGIILGLHNFAIAAPQVIATVMSSLIFKLLQKPRGSTDDTSMAWVMRFGGLAAVLAAVMTVRLDEEVDEGLEFVDSDEDVEEEV